MTAPVFPTYIERLSLYQDGVAKRHTQYCLRLDHHKECITEKVPKYLSQGIVRFKYICEREFHKDLIRFLNENGCKAQSSQFYRTFSSEKQDAIDIEAL